MHESAHKCTMRVLRGLIKTDILHGQAAALRASDEEGLDFFNGSD